RAGAGGPRRRRARRPPAASGGTDGVDTVHPGLGPLGPGLGPLGTDALVDGVAAAGDRRGVPAPGHPVGQVGAPVEEAVAHLLALLAVECVLGLAGHVTDPHGFLLTVGRNAQDGRPAGPAHLVPAPRMGPCPRACSPWTAAAN